MANRDVVVVGASAGGVEALKALVGGLPVDLPAAVLVVLHLPREAPSALPRILTRHGALPARTAIDGEPLAHGRVYVDPPDRHLLVIGQHIRLSSGPAENSHRPAVDPLFRSAARAFGPRVVGVVLSGARDDGADGLRTIGEHGGATIVQDPEEALHPGMPQAAMRHGRVDHVVESAKLGPLIGELARAEVAEPSLPDDPLLTAEVAMADAESITTDQLPGTPAGFGCPTCGGALWETGNATVPRYRCRVGHAWSPESLLDEQATALESALWMGRRALEERSSLARRMATAVDDRPDSSLVRRRHRQAVEEADAARTLIRDLIDRIGARGALPAAAEPAE